MTSTAETGVLDVPSGRPAAVPTPAPGDPRLARLSMNQRTVPSWDLPQVVEACVRAGIPAVGLWREPVAETGLERSARLVRDAGLRVSSLCRGGFLTASDHDEGRRAVNDNRRAVDEAAALGAACLVLVVGGLPEGDRDLTAARQRVADRLAELVPYAAAHGVRLALEPMHPLYCADRGVLSTLEQSVDLAEQHPAEHVGVVVDAFHVWWDPRLTEQVHRAAARIASVQIGDWITPLPPDALLSRGLPGDGHIDLAAFLALTDGAGYRGDVEVEVFNADVWAADPAAVLETTMRRWVALAGQ